MINLLLVILPAVALCGGRPLQLSFDTPPEIVAGDTLRVTLRSKDFEAIGSLQAVIYWDTAALSFVGVSSGYLEGTATGPDEGGAMRLVWYDPGGTGQTIPDGSPLLLLSFVPKRCTGASVLWIGSSDNFPLEAGRLNGDRVVVSFEPLRLPTLVYRQTATVCEGQSFDFQEKKYYKAGVYTDTLLALSGCDSVVRLSLAVLSSSRFAFDTAVGRGTWVRWGAKQYRRSGIYADTLRAANGCDSIATLTLTVVDEDIYAPTVFSPRTDGENAVFKVFAGPTVARILGLWIYDRQGALVFASERPDEGWDGRHKGRRCAPGVYVWRCDVLFENGVGEALGGSVSLVE